MTPVYGILCCIVDDGEEDGGDNQWSRGHHGQDDLWDSSSSAATYSKGGGFDLSDFAAMAQKFKEDTLALTKLDKGALGGMEDYAGMKQREDEALERLVREQAELEDEEVPVDKLLSDVVVEGDEDEDVPDWAVDEEDQAGGHAGVKSDTKRNLLLEVRSIILDRYLMSLIR